MSATNSEIDREPRPAPASKTSRTGKRRSKAPAPTAAQLAADAEFTATETTSQILLSDDHVLDISRARSIFTSIDRDKLDTLPDDFRTGLAHLIDYVRIHDAVPVAGTIHRGYPVGRWWESVSARRLPLLMRASLLAIPGTSLSATRRGRGRARVPRQASKPRQTLWITEQRWAQHELNGRAWWAQDDALIDRPQREAT